jgi:hypothetical protein
MVRGMKVGSHVNLSPTQVFFFSIKTKPYRGCEKKKMSLMFRMSPGHPGESRAICHMAKSLQHSGH